MAALTRLSTGSTIGTHCGRSSPISFASPEEIRDQQVLAEVSVANAGKAAVLAKVLDRWAQEHPDPYLDPHWPTT
jgi:hypothetical protein